MPIDISDDTFEIDLEKLSSREDSFLKLASLAKIGSWDINLETYKSTWSTIIYEIFDLDTDTPVTLKLFFSLLLPIYRKDAQILLKDVIKNGGSTSYHVKAKQVNGKLIDIMIHGQVIYDNNSKPLKLLGTIQDISEYVETKLHFKELSQLIEHSSNEIYIISQNTLNYLYVNKGACDSLGYSEKELLGMNMRDINPYMSEEEILKIHATIDDNSHTLNRTIHKCADNSTYHVQSYIHSITYKNKPAHVIFDTDISQTIELELQHKKQVQVLEYIHDSVITTDINGLITNWNTGSTTLFEYNPKELIGKSTSIIYSNENTSSIEELLSQLSTQNNLKTQATMLKKDTSKIICNLSLSVSRDEYNNIDGFIAYIQDITAQKKTEELLQQQTLLLQKQAHYDTLTGLPNRALFQDRLSQTIISSKRNKNMFALLFLDLDQFKQINDSLGHDAGDKVLIEAAKRLTSVIREDDTLARLGGDEFTLILKNIHTIQNASSIAKKIITIMQEPIIINSHNLYVTASIGISIYPQDATGESNLIKYADVAMYKAKDSGRNTFHFYSSDMTSQVFERVVLESSLRLAIKQEQFIVYYQPQFDTATDKIVGMEALMRWNHPGVGIVPPNDFIALAEETGLIIEIDRLVMQIAMQQFFLWYKEGLNPGILSLNLAMKQLNEDDFITYLLHTMKTIGFKTEWLELEVTEGQVMKNPEESIIKLNKIHSLGIEIAIDDFGTGYSSLAYLKKLPLDKLKIDREFIKDIPEDEDDMAITKAIIALGESLNFKLIAEGVETVEQKDFLIKNGCNMIQGYLYSKPLPSEKIQTLLQNQ